MQQSNHNYVSTHKIYELSNQLTVQLQTIATMVAENESVANACLMPYFQKLLLDKQYNSLLSFSMKQNIKHKDFVNPDVENMDKFNQSLICFSRFVLSYPFNHLAKDVSLNLTIKFHHSEILCTLERKKETQLAIVFRADMFQNSEVHFVFKKYNNQKQNFNSVVNGSFVFQDNYYQDFDDLFTWFGFI